MKIIETSQDGVRSERLKKIEEALNIVSQMTSSDITEMRGLSSHDRRVFRDIINRSKEMCEVFVSELDKTMIKIKPTEF